DDDGTVLKSISMSEETVDLLDEQRQKFIEKHGREPGPNDPVFLDIPHPEQVEHLTVKAMKEAGIDPAILYAYERTGRLVRCVAHATGLVLATRQTLRPPVDLKLKITLFLLLIALGVSSARAGDNEPTPKEKEEGWILLFDGKTLDGWMTSSEKPSKTPVEDGCINPHKSGGYMMGHNSVWEKYVLACDYKISKKGNNGIFIRTYSLKPRPGKDVGFNGIEVAIDDTYGTGYHDPGALYDLVKPSKQMQKPAGEWNHIVITCDKSKIAVELNGEVVTRGDLDEFVK